MTANIPFKYSYVLNNPLRFTDPSGYMYDPAEHEPTGPLLIRGQEPRYQKSWLGQGGDPFAGVGFDYGNLASAYGLSMNSRPPEVGTTWADVVNTGWVYNWGMGNYVNSYSRTIMSASDFGAYILPSMGTRLSEDQMTSVLNGVRSLGSQTQSSSGDRSWNMPLVQALGFDNHIFQYNRTTGKFFAPWTDIEVDPLAILAMSMANSVSTNDGDLNIASKIIGGVGVIGSGANRLNGRFRFRKSGRFSFGYYASGWKGNQYVKTYSVSNAGRAVSAGANVATTGIAYYQIAHGSAKPITYIDAGVGTAGIVASGAHYFYGAQIPVVGEFVAVYGIGRITWDVFFDLGARFGPSKWYGTDDTKWFR